MGIEKKGRTIRFEEELIRAIDALASRKDLPSSIIVRRFIRVGLDDQRLQRDLFGDDVTRKVTA